MFGRERGASRRSDAQADFEAFVQTRRTALLRTAFLLTGNRHDAEDLVQSALVKAVPAWGRIQGNPEPYVRRIMVNENISGWRKRRHLREVPTEVLPETASSELSDLDDIGLRSALMSLAPRQRAVVVLRYYEDLTERETAQILGIAVGTVKSQNREALNRLRQALPLTRADTSGI